LRAGHSASSLRATSGSEAMSAADRARFVHRVYRALHIAHERGGEVRLRLSPPELGNLTLELKLHDGAMTAHIEAETTAARTLLLDNLSLLKDRLATHDIRIEKFEVDLRNQSRQHSPDGQSQNPDAGRNLRNMLKRPFINDAKVEEKEASSGVRPTTTNGQLNVII
jgi:flagellar hook-length control protein FliK